MRLGREDKQAGEQIRNASHGEVAADDGMRLTCPNCGADISAEDARCPYCGELNPVGAEKAYLNALDDIKNDTYELAEDAQDGIKATFRCNVKRTVIIVVVAAAVLAALFLVANCMDKSDEKQALQDYQAREAFRAEHFAEFDRLYEAGDDDALSSYVWSLMNEPGFDASWYWEHADFLEIHDGWETLRSVADDVEAGTCSIDDYTWSVSLAFRLAKLDEGDRASSAKLSQEEEERAADYRAYAWQFLEDALQMSEGEITAFADESKDEEGRVQEDKLKKNLEVRLKQLGYL